MIQQEAALQCPYCGEEITITVETAVGDQSYVEDCAVCCRPIALNIEIDEDGAPLITASKENE